MDITTHFENPHSLFENRPQRNDLRLRQDSLGLYIWTLHLQNSEPSVLLWSHQLQYPVATAAKFGLFADCNQQQPGELPA